MNFSIPIEQLRAWREFHKIFCSNFYIEAGQAEERCNPGVSQCIRLGRIGISPGREITLVSKGAVDIQTRILKKNFPKMNADFAKRLEHARKLLRFAIRPGHTWVFENDATIVLAQGGFDVARNCRFSGQVLDIDVQSGVLYGSHLFLRLFPETSTGVVDILKKELTYVATMLSVGECVDLMGNLSGHERLYAEKFFQNCSGLRRISEHFYSLSRHVDFPCIKLLKTSTAIALIYNSDRGALYGSPKYAPLELVCAALKID